MGKYDKSGRADDGSLDPLRKDVSTIMHFLTIGGGGSSNTRQIADDLYRSMKTGKGTGGWEVEKATGKKDDGEDDDGGKNDKGGIEDVDYGMDGKPKTSMLRVKPVSDLLFKKEKTMKNGGLVRGCGVAQRGRGRGKMV